MPSAAEFGHSHFSADEIKTLCLLRWSDTKVIGKQPTGAYLLRKGKTLFEVTPLTLAEILPALDWLCDIPSQPVRISKIYRRPALTADFSEVPFETFIICDKLYQGYLATQDDALLDQLGSTLYGKDSETKKEPLALAQVFRIGNELSGILCRLLRSGVLQCHIQRPLTALWTLCLSKESRHYASSPNPLKSQILLLTLFYDFKTRASKK